MAALIGAAAVLSGVFRAMLPDGLVHGAFGGQLLFSAGAALVEALAREEPHPWPTLDALEMLEAARTSGKQIQHRRGILGKGSCNFLP